MKNNLTITLLSNLLFFFAVPFVQCQIHMTPDRVGIQTQTPDFELDVAGNLFVRSNEGGIMLGYPDNGNQWRKATINAGQDILHRFKPSGSSNFITRMVQFGNGDVAIGADPGFSAARLEVLHNSGITDPQLLLTEQQNDFARLTFENTTHTDKRWTIAGYLGSSPGASELNFWFQDASGGKDLLTIEGSGEVGISGTNPTARLHLHQEGQAVGRGLRFDDGVNSDWDITHGFGLRFHYGGTLRGVISATTGAYIQSSDKRLKKGIKNMERVLPKVQQLRPTAYNYKTSKSKTETIGFIAQEVAPVFPELVEYSEVDDVYGINYAGFSVVAIKAIQELKAEVDARDQRVADLEARLDRLEKLLATGQTAQNYLLLEGADNVPVRAELKQNIPNPFETVTTINYRIPENAQRASLEISDNTGKVLRSMTIDQRGEIQTILDAAALPGGTYYYSLWVDGVLVATKKMVLN